MSPKQIKRFQWIKKLLASPDSGVKPAEIPALSKELETLQAKLQEEEMVCEPEAKYETV